jgi:hypothetical protein
MKSELTTLQPNENEFPKLMRNQAQDLIILATEEKGSKITGTVVWVDVNSSKKYGIHQDDWYAHTFTDLPRTECVILSNP